MFAMLYPWWPVAAAFAAGILGLATMAVVAVDHEIKVGRLPEDEFYRRRHKTKTLSEQPVQSRVEVGLGTIEATKVEASRSAPGADPGARSAWF